MKSRAFWYALVVGVVSLTSGCHCFRSHFPHVGWRLHDGYRPILGPACGRPACPAPAFRGPVVVPGGPVIPGPECHGCVGGEHPPVFHQPVGYPPVAYPPVIGNPMPLPGATIVPNELHSPMPVKPGN